MLAAAWCVVRLCIRATAILGDQPAPLRAPIDAAGFFRCVRIKRPHPRGLAHCQADHGLRRLSWSPPLSDLDGGRGSILNAVECVRGLVRPAWKYGHATAGIIKRVVKHRSIGRNRRHHSPFYFLDSDQARLFYPEPRPSGRPCKRAEYPPVQLRPTATRRRAVPRVGKEPHL